MYASASGRSTASSARSVTAMRPWSLFERAAAQYSCPLVTFGVIRQLVGVAPLHIAEDARQRVGIRLLDAVEDVLQADPDVLSDLAEVPPVAAVGQLEAVVIGPDVGRQIGAEVGNGAGMLVVPRVRDAFVEEQRKDVRLEVGGVDGAAEAVRGGPEAAFKVLLGQRHATPPAIRPPERRPGQVVMLAL